MSVLAVDSPGAETLDSEDRLRLRWGSAELPSRYFLAPLAGYTTLAFRLAVRELGGLGLATTDLVNARALLLQSRRTRELIQTCPQDRPVAVQIYGTVPEEMRDAAQWLQDYGVTSIDINMGCPVHKVVRGGGGSAMMCNPAGTVALVETVVRAVRIPVSVKMRLGWDDQNWSAPSFAREFEQIGVAGVTIHGRTRAQGFSGSVSLAGIRAVVEAVDRLPVIGNGDVLTLADAQRMRDETGCAGIAIGRGALLNPWIFNQLSRQERGNDPGPSGTFSERVAFMVCHFRRLTEHRGERFGCLSFRKVANWYCRVLRPGRAIQQRIIRIENATEFDQIVEEIRALEHSRPGFDLDREPIIAVPKGPIEHW